jgi:transposase
MNELLECGAGMDVHKSSVTVCVMTGFGKETKKQIKTFGTMTADLLLLADWLRSYNVKEIAIESTGVYWKCVYNVMEKDFEITLANPKHMKNIPGKKTDVKDSEWICTLLKHGLLKKSFIPPEEIRNLRDLTRLRKKTTQSKTTSYNRIIKQLESSNIKLKSVVSSINGTSAWNIIKAIASGETNPITLANLITTNIRSTREQVIDALTGRLTSHTINMIQLAVNEVEFCEQQIESIDEQLKKARQPVEESLQILQTFPGVGEITSTAIIAEIGANMKQFPSADHLTSWAGLAPGNNESAGKVKNTRINKGNHYLKIALVQSAWCAMREKNGYWKSLYYRLKSRLGAKKTVIAIARRILKTIYDALSTGTIYEELDLRDNPLRIQKSIEYYNKKLSELTQSVTA